MRILFLMLDPSDAVQFEVTMSELATRGHEVRLGLRTQSLGFGRLVDRACEQHDGISRVVAPKREDRWVALADSLGLGVDYLRYLSAEYADAPKLRARAAGWAPSKVMRVADWPLIRTGPGIGLLGRVMRGLERAIPDSPRITDFLGYQRPDLLMISPLVAIPSQADYVRAARSLGIRCGFLVGSWDDLTNKGLIREIPDRVYVWNEYQRRETVELHGVPAQRVVATGAPPWDDWFAWQPSTTAEQFRQRLGFLPDRPIVLYVCSTGFIAPDEPRFVESWLRALREHPDERLRTASVLIRARAADDRWRDASVAKARGVAVWPPRGETPRDVASKSNYFDSLYHSSAVVGLNTSALIEAAIVGRPVFTVLDPAYRDTQQGTLHFRYLPRDNGGPLTVAHDFPEHLAQLARALSGARPHDQADRDFVRRFVRPHGLDRPAAQILVEAIDEQLNTAPPRPTRVRARRALAATALQPLATLANRSVSQRRLKRPRTATYWIR